MSKFSTGWTTANRLPFMLIVLVTCVVSTGCLKTRAELGEQQQAAAYKKKNQENQAGYAEEKPRVVDERDDLMRQLNGRLETLENQVQQLQKESADLKVLQQQEAQKLVIVQEALAKVEVPVAPTHQAPVPSAAAGVTSSKGPSKNKQEDFENGEAAFMKKEFKEAIMSYQSYVDANPKGKHTPEAKYKIGVSFQELGKRDEAFAFYEEVMDQYPKTEAGKKAKIRLGSLKKTKKP
jgi:TolA-binding protein